MRGFQGTQTGMQNVRKKYKKKKKDEGKKGIHLVWPYRRKNTAEIVFFFFSR